MITKLIFNSVRWNWNFLSLKIVPSAPVIQKLTVFGILLLLWTQSMIP